MQFHDSSPIRSVRDSSGHTSTGHWVMIPNSRGSVAVVALLVATVFLLGCLWLAFFAGDPDLEARLSSGVKSRETGSQEPVDPGPLDEANALYSRRTVWTEALAIPGDLRFARAPDLEVVAPPETVERPAVSGLEGATDGSFLVLRWEATGGPASGYRVARVLEDGKDIVLSDLLTGAREFRDGPLDALAGSRIYRVTALAEDGSPGGQAEKWVQFRLDVKPIFLRPEPGGAARFELRWSREAETVAAEFVVHRDDEIGEARAAGSDSPALDWRTGYRFLRLKALRTQTERLVPKFRPDGRLMRNPDTEEVIYEAETALVGMLDLRAGVRDPVSGETVWLPMAK